MAGDRTNGILGISANFEPQKAAAFDARCNAPTKADLIEPATWVANDGGTYTYIGMTVHGADVHPDPIRARTALSTSWFGDDAVFANRPWEPSPPLTGGLQPGQSMACPTFPVDWEQPTP